MARLARKSAAAFFICRHRASICGLLLLFVGLIGRPSPARAITPENLEVKAMIEKGLKWLETNGVDSRLGAEALVGLCYIKHGDDETHPQVQKAVEACKAVVGPGAGPLRSTPDIYSTGLAIVFLCEVNPSKYQHEINALLKSLQARQKPNGGWGYPEKPTGDTSMTQYGVLASWEAKKNGFVVPSDSIESVCLWLIETQDPNGGWGYQGKEAQPGTSGEFVLLKQDSVRHGLSAAGLGSSYVCSDLLGITSSTDDASDVGLPPALKPVRDDNKAKLNQAAPIGKISPRQLQQTQERGRGWWREHYKIDVRDFPFYYLYALERCQSFYESVAGLHIKNPGWYDDGVNWLHKRQKADGHWESAANMAVPDTAFAILFLLRSTKKSIEKSKGFDGGMAVGGQGLPRHLNDVRVDGGKVVAKPVAGTTDALLGILANPDHADFHDLADDPRDLIAQVVAEESAVRADHLGRLRHLAAEGTAATRLAAVRVLARVRDVGNAPTLIAALSDADWRVVYTADQGLRLFSRRVGPDLLTEAPDERARAAAIADWKHWYASISPADDGS